MGETVPEMRIRRYEKDQVIEQRCSWCGKANWFRRSSMNYVVFCENCGREFLLCSQPRDLIPASTNGWFNLIGVLLIIGFSLIVFGLGRFR
jgi:hypothetical protein